MTGYKGSFETAAEVVAETIDRSVASAIGGEGKIAVAFSGGLDSSVLAVCAKRYAEVVACSVSAEGGIDRRKAREAAQKIGAELSETRLDDDGVRRELAVADLGPDATLMDRSLWCIYFAAARGAKEAGAGLILLGQLSDELFGGYAKYQAALEKEGGERAESMMRHDVEEYFRRGRARDFGACSKWLPPRLPFEAKEVVGFAMDLPISYKISNGLRKSVLRKAALILGVPAELVQAPKKAAQYSSGVQKIVARLTFFNGRAGTRQHDPITSAEGEAGRFQTTPGEVQLLRAGRRDGPRHQAGSGQSLQASEP